LRLFNYISVLAEGKSPVKRGFDFEDAKNDGEPIPV
jgi:hypothetical protein